MEKYKKYKIYVKYSEEDECYYPYITDEDGMETYDGKDVEFSSSSEEAIKTGKEFIDDMIGRL